jgi:hypothetical protein
MVPGQGMLVLVLVLVLQLVATGVLAMPLAKTGKSVHVVKYRCPSRPFAFVSTQGSYNFVH